MYDGRCGPRAHIATSIHVSACQEAPGCSQRCRCQLAAYQAQQAVQVCCAEVKPFESLTSSVKEAIIHHSKTRTNDHHRGGEHVASRCTTSSAAAWQAGDTTRLNTRHNRIATRTPCHDIGIGLHTLLRASLLPQHEHGWLELPYFTPI